MTQWLPRSGALALAATFALASAPSDAIAPMVAMFAKQMVQDAVMSTIKEALLGSLRDQGCKGIALANAISTLADAGKVKGGLPTMPNMPGGFSMPSGMAMPGGMPAMGALTGNASAMGGMLGKLAPNAGSLPADMALSAEQMEMMAEAQAAMSQPLSPLETMNTIDELSELGFLPKPVQTELKQCLVLLPQAAAPLGMGMAMLKPMIPQIREGRDMLFAASPAEQDELAVTLAQELKSVPARERKDFIELLDGGFFPPRVSEGVKARLGAK